MTRWPVERLRKDARAIFQAALEAADPYRAVGSVVRLDRTVLVVGRRRYDLKKFKEICVVGAGKGAARMAQAIEKIISPMTTGRMKEKLKDGLVVVPYGSSASLKKIEIHEAGHPIPDRQGLLGAEKIKRILCRTGEDDLVIVLISGGGSALLPAPQEGITLKDKQRMTSLLLGCGATIREINILRKHLSTLKGGRMARLAYPSTLVSLILSDIIGDPIDSIASGPTAPDSSTFQDCMVILKKYGLVKRTPANILKFLEKGLNGQADETPRQDDPAFSKVRSIIVANNLKSLRAASLKAKKLGYNAFILSSAIEGETREAAKNHAAILKDLLVPGRAVRSPACIISGGETTVTIRGKGLGGRNQEFVLAAAIEIDGLENSVVLSAGTDGTDGPTDAAGAVADGRTVSRAGHLRMDPRKYLDDNDSYHFFKKLDDLIITGPTRTNVMDIHLLLASKQ